MDFRENKENEQLRDLMHSLPTEKLPPGLDARIMERIRQEKPYAEKRSDRRILAWTIILSAIVLAIGGWVLYAYIDWSSVSFSWPNGEPENDIIAKNIQPTEERIRNYTGMLRRLIPFAAIILLLLIGDTLLRRHYFARHRNGN